VVEIVLAFADLPLGRQYDDGLRRLCSQRRDAAGEGAMAICEELLDDWRRESALARRLLDDLDYAWERTRSAQWRLGIAPLAEWSALGAKGWRLGVPVTCLLGQLHSSDKTEEGAPFYDYLAGSFPQGELARAKNAKGYVRLREALRRAVHAGYRVTVILGSESPGARARGLQPAQLEHVLRLEDDARDFFAPIRTIRFTTSDERDWIDDRHVSAHGAEALARTIAAAL
jgi:hypothetical protein